MTPVGIGGWPVDAHMPEPTYSPFGSPFGLELGYAEVTTTAASTNLTAGGDAWPGMSITVTVGVRPIIVEVWCPVMTNNTLADGAQLNLYEGSTFLAASFVTKVNANNKGSVGYIRKRLSPSAGQHTYQAKINALVGGTANFAADTTSFGPAFIRALEG